MEIDIFIVGSFGFLALGLVLTLPNFLILKGTGHRTISDILTKNRPLDFLPGNIQDQQLLQQIPSHPLRLRSPQPLNFLQDPHKNLPLLIFLRDSQISITFLIRLQLLGVAVSEPESEILVFVYERG